MILGKIRSSLLDLCLPRECPCCRAGHDRDCIFCDECEAEVRLLEQNPRCRLCSTPVTLANSPCAHCMDQGIAYFDRVASLGLLKEPLRTAIHRIKYEDRWPLADRLSDRLLTRRDVSELLQAADVLVPVPLHATRQRERGFNQADVIARRLVKRAGYQRLHSLRVVHPAVRTRPTQTQTQLPSRAQRLDNLRNAFELTDANAISGKHVIVVDDVLTTGATLLSLARVLNLAKPASLCAIVLAVADPKGKAFEII